VRSRVLTDNVTDGVVEEAEENKNILVSVKQVKGERERERKARSLWMIPW